MKLTESNFKDWITREQLKTLTGMPDRQNRQEIERLRRDGVPIITKRDGTGYKLAETEAELETFLRMEYYAKIKTMAETARAMTSYFAKDGQMSILGL